MLTKELTADLLSFYQSLGFEVITSYESIRLEFKNQEYILKNIEKDSLDMIFWCESQFEVDDMVILSRRQGALLESIPTQKEEYYQGSVIDPAGNKLTFATAERK